MSGFVRCLALGVSWRLRVGVGVVGLLIVLALPGVVLAAPSEHPFEIVPGSFHFATGIYRAGKFVSSSDQAGAHSDWTTSFEFAPAGGGATDNDVHEITVKVPAGFDASDTAVPTCAQQQLLTQNSATSLDELPDCPIDSQVGELTIEITNPGGGGYHQETVPIYNMEVSSFGVTAELGYKTTVFTGLVQIKVRPEDLGLTATTLDIPPTGELHKVVFTV